VKYKRLKLKLFSKFAKFSQQSIKKKSNLAPPQSPTKSQFHRFFRTKVFFLLKFWLCNFFCTKNAPIKRWWNRHQDAWIHSPSCVNEWEKVCVCVCVRERERERVGSKVLGWSPATWKFENFERRLRLKTYAWIFSSSSNLKFYSVVSTKWWWYLHFYSIQ